MSLDRTTRKVVYQGDGKTTVFPFAFKVFAPSDIAVEVGTPDENSRALAYGSDYTVRLNAGQEENPGGQVTVAEAPASGLNLAVVSAIPALQPMVLTPYDGFNPETLNDDSDRHVALIQQLEERVERCVSVDATDTMTPGELKQKLLDAADDATVVAKGYAEAAKQSASEAAASEANAAASAEAAAKTLTEAEATIAAKADSEIDRVAEAADGQIERVRAAGDAEIFKRGFGNKEETWTLEADLASGDTLTLPNDLTYLVGRHHLRLSWNGLLLYPGRQFAEVGDSDTSSKTVQVLMPMSTGDELDAWVGVLGNGEVAEALQTAAEARDAVADLSRRVVYREEQ